MGIPIKVPEPKSSRNTATIIKMAPYPNPFPKPSKTDGHGLLAIAKASNRPMMMQLVMISPTNTDSFEERSGRKAANTWSTIITKEATTNSCTIIRILEGIKFRSNDTIRLPIIITNSTDNDITIA